MWDGITDVNLKLRKQIWLSILETIDFFLLFYILFTLCDFWGKIVFPTVKHSFSLFLWCRCLEEEEISKVAGASQLMAFKYEGLRLCTDLSVQQRVSKGNREPGWCPQSHIDAVWTGTPLVDFSVCPASFLYAMFCNNQYFQSCMFRPPRPAVLSSSFGGSLSTAWRWSSKISC